MTRRELLQLSGGGLITGFSARGSEPENHSYPLKLIDGPVTAPNRFFVRDHFNPATVSLDRWKLRIEGRVERPYDLTFSDLVELPSTNVEAVLECAGNLANGSAVSNGLWEGIPIAALLEPAKPAADSQLVMMEGADSGRLLPDRPSLPYSQLIPLDKCREPSSIIAFQLNGLALPARNGFPARALFPAWYGMDSVKWLQRIVVLGPDEQVSGFYRSGMDGLYNRVVRGTANDKLTRLSSIQVKSAVAWPDDGQKLPSGRHLIWGFAWSGLGAVRSVAVTTGGTAWAEATVEPATSAHGWVKWTYHWNASPGDYVIMSRASDRNGNAQPLRRDASRKDAYELNCCAPLRCSVR